MEEKELNIPHISFDEAKKEIAAMNLINGFLFDSVTEDENDAKIVISKILGRVLNRQLSDIEVKPQKVYNGLDTKYHGIRFDAHITEKEQTKELVATVYDFEVEDREADRPSLPRRQRYYSSLSDSKKLATSTDYRKLPNYISVTILSYDPFLLGDMYYEARMSLVSHPESDFKYNDGVVNIFLYANGKINSNLDSQYGNSLMRMLQYIISGEKPTTLDLDIEEIDNIVTKVKDKAEVTKEFMKQWDREATLQREAAERTKMKDAIEIIRFGREDSIPDEKIRQRLETRLELSPSIIDELFNQVDSETTVNS